MIKSFLVGISKANQGWKMALTLLAANFLLALPLALPVFLVIVTTSGGTLAANRLFADKLDTLWFIDVINQQFPGVAIETSVGQAVGLLIAMGAGYLTLHAFLAGGVLGVFNFSGERFTMRRFWGEGGAHFWRFFRLTMISLLFYGAAVGVYALLRWPIENIAEKANAFESVVYKRWASMAFLALMVLFVNMVFDYARVATVVNDSKGMFREAFRALRFAFRNFFNAFGLYLLIAALSAGVFLTFNALRWRVGQSSAAGVLLAIALGQVAIAGRMWGRLVFYGAEMHLYKNVFLAPATAAAVPPIEFARAEAPEPPPDAQVG
jgi:hypothetical protein